MVNWKVVGVVVVGSIVGFMLDANAPVGKAIWGEAPAGPQPSGGELPLLMAVSLIQAVGFGLGVAFLAFGWPLLSRAGGSPGWAMAAFVAIAWGLVSWVPHSAMHVTNAHDDFARLILIEYVFHVTLVVAAAVTAWYFVGVVKSAGDARATTVGASASR